MEWLSYPENKPDEDCICYVTDIRANALCHMSRYDKMYDFFILYDQNSRFPFFYGPSLAVTHYIILPKPPKIIRND